MSLNMIQWTIRASALEVMCKVEHVTICTIIHDLNIHPTIINVLPTQNSSATSAAVMKHRNCCKYGLGVAEIDRAQ